MTTMIFLLALFKNDLESYADCQNVFCTLYQIVLGDYDYEYGWICY